MLYVRDYLTDQKVLRSPAAPESPLVSVILPTYKRFSSGRLPRAIESVLSQSFTDFELIVVDDGSTDGSNEFIEQCRAADPRVIHVRHELNSGLPALRVNEGIELARGQYIAFQFDDDIWFRETLASLTNAAADNSEPAIVVGHSLIKGSSGKLKIPTRELELRYLYETNLIANNSVLVPQFIVEKLGMFDCHIAMRRLCDWDLWLRYMRHFRFFLIDDVVSEVEIGLKDSVGMTSRRDIGLARVFHSAQRDHLLTPKCWRDYQVDSLHAGAREIDGELRSRLFEDFIVPYYVSHRHHFPQIHNFALTIPTRRKTVLCTSEQHSDVLYEILMQYDAASAIRRHYQIHYQLQPQVTSEWTREADILLLVRSLEDKAHDLVNQALLNDVAIGYLLDDDFLALHECGSEFALLAPGASMRRRLEALLNSVDTVWVTSRSIDTSITPINPRTVPYKGSVRKSALPSEVRPRQEGKRLRIGCTSHKYRIEELGQLWQALEWFSKEYRDSVEFEFWGVDIDSLPALSSPVIHRPFNHNYTLYLDQLRRAEFDILLAPLLDYPKARLAKAPNKYYLSAVAGALGIFSDVQPYEILPGELTCLKPANTVAAWYEALCRAVEMPAAEFDLMRRRMLHHVRDEFTETAEIDTHEAALRATEFHAHTRGLRLADGRPRIVLYQSFENLETEREDLAQRIDLMRAYGIEPVIVLEDSRASSNGEAPHHEFHGAELHTVSMFQGASGFYDDLEFILKQHTPAVVHSLKFAPTLSRLCRHLRVPHLSTIPSLQPGTKWQADFPYADLLQAETIAGCDRHADSFGIPVLCSRGVVPRRYFEIGVRRHLENLGQKTSPRRTLVLLFDHPSNENGASRREMMTQLRAYHLDCDLETYDDSHDRIEAFSRADILLWIGGDPQEIKQAMASGVLVVTAPSEDIAELIFDEVTGIVCDGAALDQLETGFQRALALSDSNRREIVERARRVARAEFHPSRAANDLLFAYNQVIESVKRPQSEVRRDVHTALPAEIVEDPRFPPRGHVLVSKSLQFSVVPQREHWSGLEVLIGTHLRPASGQLRLQVRTLAGEVIRETTQDLSQFGDNSWAAFRFDPIPGAATREFIADFALQKRDRDTRVSIYQSTPAENRLRRVMRRAGVRGVHRDLFCRMFYEV